MHEFITLLTITKYFKIRIIKLKKIIVVKIENNISSLRISFLSVTLSTDSTFKLTKGVISSNLHTQKILILHI